MDRVPWGSGISLARSALNNASWPSEQETGSSRGAENLKTGPTRGSHPPLTRSVGCLRCQRCEKVYESESDGTARRLH
jgi:hypothetical protein